MVFGHLFSPVLHTLTDTISTDTIYTMTFFMMLVHLIFFDYGISAAIVSNSLSLSAAIFASICLASRLSSAYHAFILIAVAIEFFVLFPLLRNKVKKSVYITGLLFVFDMYILMKGSNLFMTLFILTTVFINIVCPILFVIYQKHKSNIYGPWDEAIVHDTDDVINELNNSIK
ncbi:GPI2 domain containing protein [Asbolus verrucosus]|uniref:GPI2 domain containing protein n=1 Tax=Asbolus verrucosus TaxID=1661398 RepID=A0A482VVG3_ASBVE|nr:GPI2 domain containing protein [Asbolus verrucosus]